MASHPSKRHINLKFDYVPSPPSIITHVPYTVCAAAAALLAVYSGLKVEFLYCLVQHAAVTCEAQSTPSYQSVQL
jgi:hypothetical protein